MKDFQSIRLESKRIKKIGVGEKKSRGRNRNNEERLKGRKTGKN